MRPGSCSITMNGAPMQARIRFQANDARHRNSRSLRMRADRCHHARRQIRDPTPGKCRCPDSGGESPGASRGARLPDAPLTVAKKVSAELPAPAERQATIFRSGDFSRAASHGVSARCALSRDKGRAEGRSELAIRSSPEAQDDPVVVPCSTISSAPALRNSIRRRGDGLMHCRRRHLPRANAAAARRSPRCMRSRNSACVPFCPSMLRNRGSASSRSIGAGSQPFIAISCAPRSRTVK